MQYHILNGDGLRIQVSRIIEGKIIVARECLVDGEVAGNSLAEIFETRAQFLSQHYGATREEYFEKAASEFVKISSIPAASTINLWFEDDLFCQVNLWFVSFLLLEKVEDCSIFLVRPGEEDMRYGFGGLSKTTLKESLSNKKKLSYSHLETFASMWRAYQKNDFPTLRDSALQLENIIPMLPQVIEAHIDRFPKNGQLGRPESAILQIQNEINTDDFGQVFQKFSDQESIYGFGDLQVKRLWDMVNAG